MLERHGAARTAHNASFKLNLHAAADDAALTGRVPDVGLGDEKAERREEASRQHVGVWDLPLRAQLAGHRPRISSMRPSFNASSASSHQFLRRQRVLN